MALDHPISFQLYTARNFPPVTAQLALLAAHGYTNVEPFGPIYDDVPGFKAALDANGLSCVSGHFGLEMLEGDLDRVVSIARTLGIGIVVAPWLAQEDRSADAAGWQALGARLAAIAGRLKPHGLVLAWHNHDFEFLPLPDGSLPIEHLLAHPDVMLELDVAWVVRGGVDPLPWIRTYADRIVAVHVKDIAPAGENLDEDGWADVGQGIVGWPALWPALAETAARITIIEHDNPSDLARFVGTGAAAVKSYSA